MIAAVICIVLLVFIVAYVRWVIRPERERPTPVEDLNLAGTSMKFRRLP